MKILFNDIQSQLLMLPRTMLFFFPVVLSVAYISEHGINGTIVHICLFFKRFWRVAFLFYFSYLLTSTVFTRRLVNPFQNVFENFGFVTEGVINCELIENIILYIPYTFFFLMAFHPPKRWKMSLYLSFFSSICIEILQLLFWLGEFQLSDIIHNVVGGMLGCCCYSIVNAIKSVNRQSQ